MVVAKGNEIGNMTAVARQHELDPKMLLRWARELNRKDLDQLDGTSVKQSKFIPTAEDYAQLEKENEKLKKLFAEQALERDTFGNSISFVLRVLEVERSTYYAYVKREQQSTPATVHSSGRPVPGLSYTQDGNPVSDEQICEWLMEFLAGEGASYGYRKLTVLLRRRHGLRINKKKVTAFVSAWMSFGRSDSSRSSIPNDRLTIA
jgi:transposase-like protein